MPEDTGDQRAHQLRELGELARRNRDLAAARAYYEEASKLLRTSPNRLKFAHTIRHLGDVYTEERDWSHAEPCFIEALEIYRSYSSPPALDFANAIRSYAVLKSARGIHAEARELWVEAGRWYQTAEISEGVEECNRRASARG